MAKPNVILATIGIITESNSSTDMNYSNASEFIFLMMQRRIFHLRSINSHLPTKKKTCILYAVNLV